MNLKMMGGIEKRKGKGEIKGPKVEGSGAGCR